MMMAVETPIPSLTFHQMKIWFFYLVIVFGIITPDLSSAWKLRLEKLLFSQLIPMMLMGFLFSYKMLRIFLTARRFDEYTKCHIRVTKVTSSWTMSMPTAVVTRIASRKAPAYGNQSLTLSLTEFPSQTRWNLFYKRNFKELERPWIKIENFWGQG